MRELFRGFADKTAAAVGSPWALTVAVMVVIVWAVCGPYFNYSDAWQLVINTGTTIVTFLMVFLIQNAQNRATHIVEIKLNELLRGVWGARTSFVSLDSLSDEELEYLQGEFNRLSEKYSLLLDHDSHFVQEELNMRRRRALASANSP